MISSQPGPTKVVRITLAALAFTVHPDEKDVQRRSVERKTAIIWASCSALALGFSSFKQALRVPQSSDKRATALRDARYTEAAGAVRVKSVCRQLPHFVPTSFADSAEYTRAFGVRLA